jgi:DnaJ domain
VTLHEAYQVLGLPHEATAAQVKTAYRRLVAEAHPDHGGSAAQFIRIRAAYEILWAFLEPRLRGAPEGSPDDEIPVPPGLREVIDRIVADFREQQRWAEAETLAHLAYFEKRMAKHIQVASRAELRRFSAVFSETWDSVIDALFTKCNSRCDAVLQRYETWYTESTQALFDSLYRRELLRFAFRRRFWEVFVVLGAIAGALSVVVGWEGPWRRWVSLAMVLVAAAAAFLAHRWSARRGRRVRERVEPLSVVVFEIDKNARFATESTLRRGRRTTTALGLAGAYLGNAASGGFAIPVVGAVAGAAIGGALDRIFNPLGQMREGMQRDLRRFMAMARPQVTAYVLEAHNQLLDDVRVQVVDSYQERSRGVVRLLTAGAGSKSDRP